MYLQSSYNQAGILVVGLFTCILIIRIISFFNLDIIQKQIYFNLRVLQNYLKCE